MTDPTVSEIEMFEPSSVAYTGLADRRDSSLRPHREKYREWKSDKKRERAHRGDAEQNQQNLGVGQLRVLHGRGCVLDVVDVDREMDQKRDEEGRGDDSRCDACWEPELPVLRHGALREPEGRAKHDHQDDCEDYDHPPPPVRGKVFDGGCRDGIDDPRQGKECETDPEEERE